MAKHDNVNDSDHNCDNDNEYDNSMYNGNDDNDGNINIYKQN